MSPECEDLDRRLRIRTWACFGAQRRPQRPKSCIKLTLHPTEMIRQPGAPQLSGYLRHKPMSPECEDLDRRLRIRTWAYFGAQRRPQRPKSCTKLARHPTVTMRHLGAPGRAECRRHTLHSRAFHRALLPWAQMGSLLRRPKAATGHQKLAEGRPEPPGGGAAALVHHGPRLAAPRPRPRPSSRSEHFEADPNAVELFRFPTLFFRLMNFEIS